jgi:hypothetical protein
MIKIPVRMFLKAASLILAAMPLVVAGPVNGETIDEAWYRRALIAGRYDQLLVLKKMSDEGNAWAMARWGSLDMMCLYEGCNEARGQALMAKAADAGDSLAKEESMSRAKSRDDLEKIAIKGGPLRTQRQKLAYAHALMRLAFSNEPAAKGDAIALVKSMLSAEPIEDVVVLAMYFPELRDEDLLKALAKAGVPDAIFRLHRFWLEKGVSDAQILDRAQHGDIVASMVICEWAEGGIGRFQPLSAKRARECEKATMAGSFSSAKRMLMHQDAINNTPAIRFYLQLCEKKPLIYLNDLWTFHARFDGMDAASTKHWFGVQVMMNTREHWDRVLDLEERREAVSAMVRAMAINESCGDRRYDAGKREFESAADCPLGRPIAIPAELLNQPVPARI